MTDQPTLDQLTRIHIDLYTIRENHTDQQLKGHLHHATWNLNEAITRQRTLNKNAQAAQECHTK